MKVIAVDFVVYSVKDMSVALKFYRDTLGLKTISEGDGWSEFDLGNLTLSISLEDTVTPGDTAVALAVEDVAAARAELKAAGVTVDDAGDPPLHMAVIYDPDGNALWLHRRDDGTAG